jgi:hypothetical protein
MLASGGAAPESIPETAFYYPGPVWAVGDWVKNLILFFDGVALLVPEYIKDKPERIDPVTVAGLEAHGLLHILEPEKCVDKQATEQLAMAMTDVIASGVLDDLAKQPTEFHELSYSRMGSYGDRALAKMLLEELKSRGLARESEDGYSIPMHPMVRALMLVLLAQILRPYGKTLGMELSPATDRAPFIGALRELLSLPSAPSAGSVVTFDLATVGVDLGSVPIDEVLDFRKAHLKEYRGYARNVRGFVRELSLMSEEERSGAFADRQAELDDYASDLRAASRSAWKQPSTFALTLSGAAWTLATGDPMGALLSAGGALLGGILPPQQEAGAYSYLFRAGQRLS